MHREQNEVENEDEQACWRCLVAGRVQGVFFRAATREKALGLGLTGYARNLPDGRVEVLACGPLSALTRLRGWLEDGPPLARVAAVNCEAMPYQAHAGFSSR